MTARLARVGTRPAAPIHITVVHAPVCHFCADAEHVLAGLAEVYPIVIELVEISSAEGQQLVRAHRPAMSPLVLVDGEFFSAGRLPRKKLTKLLGSRANPMPVRLG